jgi:putative resolvase
VRRSLLLRRPQTATQALPLLPSVYPFKRDASTLVFSNYYMNGFTLVESRTNQRLSGPYWDDHYRGPDETRAKIVQRVAIYARVSSREHQLNLEWQAERLQDYCAAKGYQITTVVKEIASGVNDARPKFLALLRDPTITTIVVEHKDRATRFGFRYLETLLELSGRGFEVVNLAENNREDLLVDLTSILYSFMARLYGQWRAKRKTEALVHQLQEENEKGEQ